MAIVTHTPEPTVWLYTLGGLVRRMQALPALLPLINPFVGGSDDVKAGGPKTITGPNEIRAFCARVGIKSGEVDIAQDQ